MGGDGREEGERRRKGEGNERKGDETRRQWGWERRVGRNRLGLEK